jgi:hypothetical protein
MRLVEQLLLAILLVGKFRFLIDYEDETILGEHPEGLVYDGAFSSEEYDVFKDDEELVCGLENPETCESCE